MQTAAQRRRLRPSATLILTLALSTLLSQAAFGQENEAVAERNVTEQIQTLVQDLGSAGLSSKSWGKRSKRIPTAPQLRCWKKSCRIGGLDTDATWRSWWGSSSMRKTLEPKPLKAARWR